VADSAPNDAKSPSPMLRYLDDALEKVFPDEEYRKLTAHDAEMARTTSRGDFHRCFRCAEWAVDLVARSAQSEPPPSPGQPEPSHLHHLASGLREVMHESKDTGWALEFGIFKPGRTVTDVELTWVDDAIKVAQAAAETSGWGAVPWENLLEELIAIEPATS
jgi:hypothetical protein